MWKEIYGFEDYLINSETQEIKSKDRYIEAHNQYGKYQYLSNGKTIKPFIKENGYLTVGLQKNKKRYHNYVHLLMMKTFKPVPNMENLEVNHIDHNKLNNNLDNLEWCTHKENIDKMIDFYIENPDKKPTKETIFHVKKYCEKCGKELSNKKSKLCEECYQNDRRVVFDDYIITSKGKITKDELYQLLKKNSFCAVGRMFDVSDNAIRRWCKNMNIPYKAKDYK